MTREGILRCVKTRVLADTQRWIFKGVSSTLHLFLRVSSRFAWGVYTGGASLLIFQGNFVWWSLRSVAAYNTSVEDVTRTADDCLPPLILTQRFAAAKLGWVFRRRQWNGNGRPASVWCVCEILNLSRKHCLFNRFTKVSLHKISPPPNKNGFVKKEPNLHCEAGSGKIDFALTGHITARAMSQNIPQIRTKVTTWI